MSEKSIENRQKAKEHRKMVKNHLKTLVRSSKSHPARAAGRVVKYGAVGFMRNFWLSMAAILVMVVTLTVLFATVVSNVILDSTARVIREKIDITVYLKPGTEEIKLAEAKQRLMREENVKEVRTASSEQEMEKFLAEQKAKKNDEVVTVLNDPEMRKIMLASMNATLTVKVREVEKIAEVQRILKEEALFKETIDESKPTSYEEKRTTIEKITSWAKAAQIGGVALVVIFLVISTLVVFNTIRMAIFSRREEIYMMRLVGAGSGMVRGPFVVEARLVGMIAGGLAAGLSLGLLKLFLTKVNIGELDVAIIQRLFEMQWAAALVGVMMVIGMVIGGVSARMAMGKYLRK